MDQYIGLIAAALTTLSFIPQVIKVLRTKDTSGISLIMYSLFVLGVFLWIIHGIIIRDVPIIMANCFTLVLSSIVLAYKIKYK